MQACKLFLFSLAIIGFTCGCGSSSSGPETFPATGTVTLDGTPLATGTIVLDPIDGAGQGCSTEITAGAFEMDACVGKMKVSITSNKEGSKLDEYGEVISESALPMDKYDRMSQLTTEVTADGPNTFTFELTSDPIPRGR